MNDNMNEEQVCYTDDDMANYIIVDEHGKVDKVIVNEGEEDV